MAPHVDGRGFGESRMTKKEEKNLLAKTPAPEPSSPRRAAGSRREATMRLPTWSESLETPRREGNRGARKRRGARFVFARRGEQPESNKVMSFFFFFFFRSLSLSKKKTSPSLSLSLSYTRLRDKWSRQRGRAAHTLVLTFLIFLICCCFLLALFSLFLFSLFSGSCCRQKSQKSLFLLSPLVPARLVEHVRRNGVDLLRGELPSPGGHGALPVGDLMKGGKKVKEREKKR